jgi:hypothetical protein
MFGSSTGRLYALIITRLTKSTSKLELEDKERFAMFVAAVVGLASVRDPFSFNNSRIYLPVGGLWDVHSESRAWACNAGGPN